MQRGRYMPRLVSSSGCLCMNLIIVFSILYYILLNLTELPLSRGIAFRCRILFDLRYRLWMNFRFPAIPMDSRTWLWTQNVKQNTVIVGLWLYFRWVQTDDDLAYRCFIRRLWFNVVHTRAQISDCYFLEYWYEPRL